MEKKDYPKPMTRVIELQHCSTLLQASPTKTTGNPKYNGFNKEEEW